MKKLLEWLDRIKLPDWVTFPTLMAMFIMAMALFLIGTAIYIYLVGPSNPETVSEYQYIYKEYADSYDMEIAGPPRNISCHAYQYDNGTRFVTCANLTMGDDD